MSIVSTVTPGAGQPLPLPRHPGSCDAIGYEAARHRLGVNSTRMHVWTRLSERWKDKAGLGVYADRMQELDWVVGELVGKLDDLGIADNTVVVFATDNGAEKFTWPDGGASPFHGEKGLGWEGGFRTPLIIRWPGKIASNQVLNGIISLEDMVPTVMAAAGVPDIKERLLTGHQAGEKHFRVHVDGYNQLPYLTGEVDESPRHEFFYYSEHDLFAMRYNNWKVHFQVKDDWFAGALLRPTIPRPVNLRVDPFEQHMDAPSYPIYAGEKLWTVLPAAASSSSMRRHSQTSRPGMHLPTSTHKRSSRGQSLQARRPRLQESGPGLH